MDNLLKISILTMVSAILLGGGIGSIFRSILNGIYILSIFMIIVFLPLGIIMLWFVHNLYNKEIKNRNPKR